MSKPPVVIPPLQPMALASWLMQQKTDPRLAPEVRRYIYALGGFPDKKAEMAPGLLGYGTIQEWADRIRTNAANHDPIVAAFIAQKLTGETQ